MIDLPFVFVRDVVHDFDAERSVVTVGSKNNPNGFILKPTIRAVAAALTGSISGTVTNPDDLPTAYAIANNDTVTSTAVDTTTGLFRLAFLLPQSYTVIVSDTSGKLFTRENVAVGEEFEVGR